MGAKFVGKFIHTVDTKGRLMVPSKYRAIIEQQTLYLLPGLSGNLDAYTEDAFDDFSAKLLSLTDITEEEEEAIRLYLSEADYVNLDPQGRILLSNAMRESADLEGETVLNGRLDHFEIWNPKRWDAMSAPADEAARAKVHATVRDLKRRF